MAYTDKQKLKIVSSASHLVATTDDSVVSIASRSGVSIRTIYNWVKESEELANIWFDACTTRAHKYWHEMKTIADNIEEFWTDHDGSLKERQQAVNRAKFRCDICLKFAAQLAPEYFSDKSKELKEIQKDMEEIKKKLFEKSN